MNTAVENVLMIASVMLTGIILYFVYGFRRERGIRYLIGVIVCRIIYSGSILLEKNSELLLDKLFFRHMQSTTLNLMVPFVMLFVLRLIGRDTLKPRWQALLFAVFALWSLLSWFDAELHMIYRAIELVDGHLMTTKTAYSITFSVLCYGIVSVCVILLFKYIRSIRYDYSKPGMWVLALSTIPLVLEIAKLMNPAWSTWLLPLSVYCSFAGTLMLVIMLRIKFFSTVPIARNIVLDALQEGIVIANASGRVIDHNQQASDWFKALGYMGLDGRNIADLLKPWSEWHKLCRSMQQGRVEIDHWLNGERRIYSVNVYPLRVAGRDGQGSISLIVDITEKERHLEQIAELNRMKDQLFTIVSHDIRSPLAIQYQLVELLEEDRGRMEPQHRELIQLLGNQIRGTLGMTNNLLEWFRSQREDMTLRPERLDLHEVVEDCCEMLRMQSEAKQLEVRNRVANNTRVYADREALGLIMRNLLSNAVKFTGLGGTVQVDARTAEKSVIVTVRDNGVGMTEEQARHLFAGDRLYSSAGTSGEKGTGLGLLVSRQFVQRSGGELWAESTAGQGSAFHFTIVRREGAEG